MANGFGSDLWKNLQAIKVTRDGGIQAPVRANSRQGIVAGVDAIAKSDAAGSTGPATQTPGLLGRMWKRLLRR